MNLALWQYLNIEDNMRTIKEGLSREELRAVVEPLIDELDEFENANRNDFYITWNFGQNKNGEVTGGLDITIDGEDVSEENIKDTLERIFRKHGFDLDDDITHENPIQTLMGAWHYQIKETEFEDWHDDADQEQVDEPDYIPELVDDDMNAGSWYESLENPSSNMKFIIKYGKGRPGGDSEIVEFSTYEEARQYAANHARGWGFEVEPLDESFKESEEPTKDDIIDWLSEHDQAWEDACDWFGSNDLSEIDYDDIIDWIFDHDTLSDDLMRHFGKEYFIGEVEALDEDLGDLFKRIHDTDEYNWNLHDCDYTEFYDELKQYMEPGETWDEVDAEGYPVDTNVDLITLFRRMPKDKQIDFMDRFYIREDFSGFFSDYDLED